MSRTGIVKGIKIEDRNLVAQAVREFRLSNGWTQAEMGKVIGISGAHIGLMESIPKYKDNRISVAHYVRFRDAGLDLKSKGIADLVVADFSKGKRVKVGAEDFSIKYKGDKFNASMRKALELVAKAKAELVARVIEIDKDVNRLEREAERLLSQAENLKAKKTVLQTRIHKTELGIDNINNSMIHKEVEDEIPPQA